MSGPDRRSDEVDQLAEDFVARLRRGETPSIDEYAAAHPELADQIRSVFPMLGPIEAAGNADRDRAEPPSFAGLQILTEIAPGVGGMGKVFTRSFVRQPYPAGVQIEQADNLYQRGVQGTCQVNFTIQRLGNGVENRKLSVASPQLLGSRIAVRLA